MVCVCGIVSGFRVLFDTIEHAYLVSGPFLTFFLVPFGAVLRVVSAGLSQKKTGF